VVEGGAIGRGDVERKGRRGVKREGEDEG